MRDVLLPGATAGALGSLVSGTLALGASWALGSGAWTPLRLLVGCFYRGAGSPPALLLALGAVLGMGAGSALGILFATLLPRGGNFVAPLCLALLFGLCASVAWTLLLESFADPVLARSVPDLAILPFALVGCAPMALVHTLRWGH